MTTFLENLKGLSRYFPSKLKKRIESEPYKSRNIKCFPITEKDLIKSLDYIVLFKNDCFGRVFGETDL